MSRLLLRDSGGSVWRCSWQSSPPVSLVCSLLESTMLCLACVLSIGVRWLQLPGVFQTSMDVIVTLESRQQMELTLRLRRLLEPVLRGAVTAQTRLPLGLVCAYTTCGQSSHTALILYPQANGLPPFEVIYPVTYISSCWPLNIILQKHFSS